MTAGAVQLVTGPIGAGKTSYCVRVVEAAASGAGPAAAAKGILSLARFEGEVKNAIVARDVSNGQERILATPHVDHSSPLQTRHWAFDPGTMAWCNQVFELAPPCDLLVVDELGPLEFERGVGFLEGLKAVDSRHYRMALVTVRPSLLQVARARWPHCLTVDLAQVADRERSASQLAELLKEDIA